MSFASRISSLRGSIAKLGSSTSSVNPHKAIAELMEKNKEFVVSDPAAAAKLHKQLFFTYLNSLKKSSDVARTEYTSLRQNFKSFGDLSLSQATTGAIFGIEVLSWFAVGEVIGRGFKFSSY